LSGGVSLAELNGLPAGDFVAALEGIFEHSPWVPEAVAGARPFDSVDDLHAAMVAAVAGATDDAQVALLRAHPMLAGGAQLTAASAAEQASHGLTALDNIEAERFAAANQAYLARFGFPFIIAVRGQRDRAAILAALEARQLASPAAEQATALAEVGKIARFRLDALIRAEPAGWISVHVLDTARGLPAAGMLLMLDRCAPGGLVRLGEWRTNSDGRCDAPLLKGDAMTPGIYQITFAVAAWRAADGLPERGFYDEVPIRFCVDDAAVHYHIPLLVSPYGYSTYRGS
jgi:2-oxo-4-hydroxy-4-carboxy-5-ureidoimidazoline decarboxylase